MPRHNEDSLPRWAHVMKEDVEEAKKASLADDYLSAEQEEMYLRTRTFHALAHRVDQAVTHAIQTHTSPLVDQIQDFFDMVSPTKMVIPENISTEIDYNHDPTASPRPSKRQRTSPGKSPFFDELHDLLAMEQTSPSPPRLKSPVNELNELLAVEPPKHHASTLLPVAMVQSPSSLLDRREILRQLSSSFQRSRPAVCWLHNVGKHRHRTLIEEILRQCIRQEPHPATYDSLLKQTGKSYSSWTEALLAWAQHTVSFDSIVILLENLEVFSLPTLQDFLQLLNSLRSEHGLPVNVVMLGLQDGRGGLQLRSSAQGVAGMLVRDFTLPSSRVLYERIWELLWIEPDYRLPVVLPASMLRCIRKSFVNHQASAVRAATMVKRALAHHLSQPGSFLAGIECDELMNQEWNRMAWYCVDRDARECVIGADQNTESVHGSTMKHWLEDVDDCRRALRVVLKLLQDICRRGRSTTPEWMEDASSSSPPGEIRSRISGLLTGLSRQEILTRLARWRREIQSFAQNKSQDAKSEARELFEKYVDNSSTAETRGDSILLQDLLGRLDDLIILANKGFTGEGLTAEKELVRHMENWVRSVFRQGAILLDKPSKDSNPLASSLVMSETHAGQGIESMSTQPRRSVAAALLNTTREPKDDADPASYVPSEMFRLIRNRIEIARDDWFQLFLQNDSTGRPREEAWSLFAFGLYQLLHCGLIREKRGNFRDNIYEKAALVWCSGE